MGRWRVGWFGGGEAGVMADLCSFACSRAYLLGGAIQIEFCGVAFSTQEPAGPYMTQP